MPKTRRNIMKVLLGIILGALLTVGATYLYDSHNALQTSNTTTGAGTTIQATGQRPLVNWDVVATKWDRLTTRARAQRDRIASST
jgi:hypothetical protein